MAYVFFPWEFYCFRSSSKSPILLSFFFFFNVMRQGSSFILLQASLIALLVKNPPAGSIPGLGRSIGERIGYPLQYSWASLVAQLVKNPPAMWETWVRSLAWEDSLEKGKDVHSHILA